MDVWMNGQMGCIDGWMNGQMNGWTNGWIDGWTDGLIIRCQIEPLALTTSTCILYMNIHMHVCTQLSGVISKQIKLLYSLFIVCVLIHT